MAVVFGSLVGFENTGAQDSNDIDKKVEDISINGLDSTLVSEAKPDICLEISAPSEYSTVSDNNHSEGDSCETVPSCGSASECLKAASPGSYCKDPSGGCAKVPRLDFNDLGKKLLELSPQGQHVESSADVIWKHPTSGACLYVGNQQAASSQAYLKTCGVRHVVVCLANPTETFEESEVDYLHFPISYWYTVPGATTDKGIAQICAPMLGWVCARLEQGHPVLLHGFFGVHRAGTTGIACLMHLSDLSADAAISEAKSKRETIDPHFFDFADVKFLKRLEKARQEGLVDTAIKEAANNGYEWSMALVFGGLVGCRNNVTQDSNGLDKKVEDVSLNDFDSPFGSADTHLENSARSEYSASLDSNYSEGDSCGYVSERLERDSFCSNSRGPPGGCATVARQDCNDFDRTSKLLCFDFSDFLKSMKTMQSALGESLADHAIKEAATSGYESSMAAVFCISGGRDSVREE
jgi:dual specificity MAP kinase phosphatase